MSTNEATFTLSEKGNKKLCYNSYVYNFQKTSKVDPNLSFWTCEQYWKTKCTARVHVHDEAVVKSSGNHNHAPNGIRKLVLEAYASAKEEASTSTSTTQRIVCNAYSHVPAIGANEMPQESSLKRTIQRKRRKVENVPPEPHTLEELQLPDSYQVLSSGERFLLRDSGGGNDRILIFATSGNLQLLGQCSTIFSDGTFSTAPSKLFVQIYTIHGDFNGSVIPLVYALLPSKSQTTYTRLLSALGNYVELQPSVWLTDFEKAAINAIEGSFPGTSKGCFFHLQQCIWRKVVELGMKSLYEEESGVFSLSVRCLAALAFVPAEDVIDSFHTLINNEEFDRRAIAVATYFEDVWIGAPDRHTNIRAAPLFPLEMWNMHEQALEGSHRTNNSVEGWHRRFQSVLGCFRPCVFRCISALKREQHMVSSKVERLLAGNNPPPSKKSYRDLNIRVKTTVENYANFGRFQYLKGIAHSYMW